MVLTFTPWSYLQNITLAWVPRCVMKVHVIWSSFSHQSVGLKTLALPPPLSISCLFFSHSSSVTSLLVLSVAPHISSHLPPRPPPRILSCPEKEQLLFLAPGRTSERLHSAGGGATCERRAVEVDSERSGGELRWPGQMCLRGVGKMWSFDLTWTWCGSVCLCVWPVTAASGLWSVGHPTPPPQ